jgi:hypothetical protein
VVEDEAGLSLSLPASGCWALCLGLMEARQ